MPWGKDIVDTYDETMIKYLKMVKTLMTRFKECFVEYAPREENMTADALSKFASSEIDNYAMNVYFKVLKAPNFDARLVAPISHRSCWMDPIKLICVTKSESLCG